MRLGIRELCPHEYKRGIADDGTPWAAFYHLGTGEIIAHISRSANGYTLMWSDRRRFEVERLDSLSGMWRWAGKAAQAIQQRSPLKHYLDPTYL